MGIPFVTPGDQMDAIHDAFSYGGVRDTLRNVMEYHLDLDPDQWGYWLKAEPHGMGAASKSDEDAGLNACYTHIHVGVYFDGGRFDDLRPVASEFERVIDKHLEVCDPAGWSAHNYDAIDDYLHEDNGCISMNADVGNLDPTSRRTWVATPRTCSTKADRVYRMGCRLLVGSSETNLSVPNRESGDPR